MKKTMGIAILVLLTLVSNACDICGCGGSNLYMGLLPDFKTKFIGIRYHHMQYHTQLDNDPGQFSNNYYNSVEIWTGWNIGSKWQVLAFVPYHFNKQSDDDGVSYKNGLGDITAIVNYKLFQSRTTKGDHTNIDQVFWIGAGVKLPTGSFKVDVNDLSTTIADINAQIGTGSTDILFNAMHHISINNAGLNSTLNYKIGTANGASYKFGNKITAGTVAYYRFRLKGTGIMPNAGLLYEQTQHNTLEKQKVDLTGGHAVSVQGGIEFNVNKIGMGISLQKPIDQEYAAGQTEMKWRGTFHVTFAL